MVMPGLPSVEYWGCCQRSEGIVDVCFLQICWAWMGYWSFRFGSGCMGIVYLESLFWHLFLIYILLYLWKKKRKKDGYWSWPLRPFGNFDLASNLGIRNLIWKGTDISYLLTFFGKWDPGTYLLVEEDSVSFGWYLPTRWLHHPIRWLAVWPRSMLLVLLFNLV